MKLHRTLVMAVAQALQDILQQRKHADKVIERLLKYNPKWGSRDRAFIAENTYEIVRWWRLLWSVGSQWSVVGGGQEDAGELKLEDFTRLVGINILLKQPETGDLPTQQFPEFRGLEAKNIHEQKKALAPLRSIRQSIPDWLDEMGFSELDADWDAEMSALNSPAPMVVRCNTLKTSKTELKKALDKEGWNCLETPLAPDALVLGRRGNVFLDKSFQQGLFELQDAGSQCIAPFLEAEPGMRVVDACAGAGGKSLHLAAMMQNRGSIISLDTEAWKLEELRRRARRNGVGLIQTRPIESSKTIKRLHGTADRLLLDVPCSGLGTLRRNPDAKWKLSPSFIEKVRSTQANILESYAKILKPGGLLVYATCSILPSENEQQIQRFLSQNPNFKLQAERRISPQKDGFDGFYMARLKFNG